MTRPLVSIVMPAYNAAQTIEQSVASVRAQDYEDWQLVIVDDGSTDDTVETVKKLADQDHRIHYIHQSNRGVSRARNTGIEQAEGEWIVFLDSDDTIHPRYLTKMLGTARRENADIVVCGYARTTDDGHIVFAEKHGIQSKDGCAELAARAYFPIHAALVKRSHILKAGGFDPALTTCEDWDLWLKIAGSGVTFAAVDKTLAYYRNTPRSLSKNAGQMFDDANEILRRQNGESYGPAIARYKPDSLDIARRQTWLLLWNAAIAAAQGESTESLYGKAAALAVPTPGEHWHIDALVEGLSIGGHVDTEHLTAIWPTAEPAMTALLKMIEDKTGDRGLANRIMLDLCRAFFDKGRLRTALYTNTTAFLRFSDLLHINRLPPDIDCLYVQGFIGKTFIRLPGIPVLAPPTVFSLMPVIAFELAQQIEPVSFKRRVFRKILKALTKTGRIGKPASYSLLQAVYLSRTTAPVISPDRDDQPEAAPEKTADNVWEQLFTTEDPWDYTNPYEQTKYRQTLDLLPSDKIESALELACAEGHFTVALCDRVEHLLATDISETALKRAAQRCEGKTNSQFAVLDFMNQPIDGHYDLIVCSEVLYYTDNRKQLDGIVVNIAQALKPGGYLLTAHARLLADDPSRTGFDWDHEYGADRIVDALQAHQDLRPVSTLSTELYRIDLFRKSKDGTDHVKHTTAPFGIPLPANVAASVVWGGALKTRMDAFRTETTHTIPVLMYHRIATGGPEALAPYRVSPVQFEQQLRYLRRHGFYALSPDALHPEWPDQTLQGRPVIISFDDACLDFATTAWPILQRNGFTAHMFVPTGHAGGHALWDDSYGSPAPLMGWNHMRTLAEQGVTFGSHLVTHRQATRLGSKELLEEARQSKAVLEQELEQPVTTIAPPYGAFGFREQRLFQIAGYSTIYSAGPYGLARAGRTVIPRLLVDGRHDLNTFVSGLGMDLPAPDNYDLDTTPFETVF
ncbi:MAG: glycosyltransferase [Rhodospirillales bacterium]|nr:glycosyltransferase [Rhodospirillales bacterium]